MSIVSPAAALLLAAAEPTTAVTLACEVALLSPQRQLTAPTPVAISFVADGKKLRDIRVVDTGGILYPGANLEVVSTPEAVRMQSVPTPAERPGTWTGATEKKMYRLKLTNGTPAESAEIGIGRAPAAGTGRFGLIWNASHKPKGLPQPITGSGVGNCAPAPVKDSQ